ncbi:Glycosyl transferases group 1 [Cyclobacterium lianum]|uniref:Glycosyl transferases group 1 n=1 Tax=Cyclobacterium lianum TaxID=388280 RepID=A0A1M7NGT0_9BACT|nr:glycosyltransferase [Cyclobacterium lianum]SHN02900.1 Glycosyl transferases group 1 [Cyclobacterium lianum]
MEFVIYTNTVWDSPPRSRHQLAHALAEKYKVTFVSSNRNGRPGMDISQVNDNFQVIIPSFPVSRRIRYRMPLVNEMYQLWLFPKLKHHFKGKDVVLICSDFGAHLIGRYFNRFIYYASDDYINNVKVPALVRAYTIFTQKRLLKTATISLATARKLVDDFKKINPRSFELPLGAPDFSKFNSLPVTVRKRDGIIRVVLLGFIDRKKTPVGLMNAILEIPHSELHLIGPIADDFLEHLSSPGRVVAHGTMMGENLHRQLIQMDVAIAPYYMDDPNTGRTPNKLWQYLACGRPAVITNLLNVRHWDFPEGTVYKANDDEQFVSLVKKAYTDDNQQLIDQRINLAMSNSWAARREKLVEYIEKNVYDEDK